MNKKIATALTAFILAGSMSIGLAGCGFGNFDIFGNSGDNGNEKNGEIYAVYESYAAAAQANGDVALSYEQWLASIKGENGKDGVTPTILINDDGYWVINGTVTDVKAKGEDGVGVDEVYINDDGNLIVKLTNGVEENCGSLGQTDMSAGLAYAAVKVDGEIIGYNVRGIGMSDDMDLVIPATYKGKPVIGISDGAFRNFDADIIEPIHSITIPDSVTTIGAYAFAGTPLTEITIPDSVTTIGDGAFDSCQSLTEITIPDGVTNIGEATFYGCKSLTEITIPDSVTTIGMYAFSGCQSLTEITIPDSVTTIGDGAFSGCTSLKKITIPASVTTITGGCVLNYCTSLTEIQYAGTVEQWLAIGGYFGWIPQKPDFMGMAEISCAVYCSDGEIDADGEITKY